MLEVVGITGGVKSNLRRELLLLSRQTCQLLEGQMRRVFLAATVQEVQRSQDVLLSRLVLVCFFELAIVLIGESLEKFWMNF